jgi:tetratricopeptide (TPR) repeat protein
MIPKLTGLQWLLFSISLFFYGFAVFALTRDYYLRHPPRPVAAAEVAGGSMATGDRIDAANRRALADAGSSLPPALLEADPVLLGQEADRLFAARRFEAAVPLYRRVLELAPEDVDARNDLGLSLHYLGDSDQALQVLEVGAEAAPDFQRIRLTLGFVAAQAGELALARDALRMAHELDPETAIGAEAARLLAAIEARAGAGEAASAGPQ